MSTPFPKIPPLTLTAAPVDGYVVKGGYYDNRVDELNGLAFAGDLDQCLEYMRVQMLNGRNPPSATPCTCGR